MFVFYFDVVEFSVFWHGIPSNHYYVFFVGPVCSFFCSVMRLFFFYFNQFFLFAPTVQFVLSFNCRQPVSQSVNKVSLFVLFFFFSSLFFDFDDIISCLILIQGGRYFGLTYVGLLHVINIILF